MERIAGSNANSVNLVCGMHVIGTAGHVDHGKSSLIQALTGVHPDRLKEEQQREMTIELGFGWLSLDNGQEVGIVDVPGHIDFIGNLLSGIGGIDAVLFVIAADEGIKPQTLEHEAIIRLLQIPYGLIVLTKIDKVKDAVELSLLKEEIQELFKNSLLHHWSIHEVSSKTGEGIDELKLEINRLVQKLPQKIDYGRPRLPVDRVFQLQGIGTVVTGTLQDGHFSNGNPVILQPQQVKGHIRELQIHGKKVSEAVPGNRVAINISGISKADIQRGDIVCLPETYHSTRRMDVSIQLLPTIFKSLDHNSHVQLFIGAKAVDARIRVLGCQELLAGEQGFLQLEFTEPIVAMRNDRFILRRFSPGETIGGGRVLNPNPSGRYKRFEESILQQMAAYLENDTLQLIRSLLKEKEIVSFISLPSLLNLSQEEVEKVILQLETQDEIVLINRDSHELQKKLITGCDFWKNTQQNLLDMINEFHIRYPLLAGIPLVELRNQYKGNEALLMPVLNALITNGTLQEIAHQVYAVSGHKIKLTQSQENVYRQLSKRLHESGHKPPSLKELSAEFDVRLLNDFVKAGYLERVDADILYLPEQIEEYKKWIIHFFENESTLQLFEFRDAFQTSRKYAQALLEYFDRIHFTERIEDHRVIYKK
jgi:selenocysteine-specific elongation factor